MSNRGTIYTKCTSALEASASIAYVTREQSENPNAWKENLYPAVRLIDGVEVKERFAFPGSTLQMDMKSTLSLEYTGYVRELNRSAGDLIDAQNSLAAAVEKAIVTDTTILGLVADVVPDDTLTSRGNSEGLAWVSGGFVIIYYYNHTAP